MTTWTIAWDVSHQEFTIDDHYYFSKLAQFLTENHAQVQTTHHWTDLANAHVIVLNYPEKPFSHQEIQDLLTWFTQGKRIIFAGYYQGEDNVTHILNAALEPWKITLLDDEVRDPLSCYCGDDLLIITENVKIPGVHRLLLPCTASLKIEKHNPWNPPELLVLSEESARSSIEGDGPLPLVARITHPQSQGECIVLGTCVFWDNFAIPYADNLQLAAWLLLNRTNTSSKTQKP